MRVRLCIGGICVGVVFRNDQVGAVGNAASCVCCRVDCVCCAFVDAVGDREHRRFWRTPPNVARQAARNLKPRFARPLCSYTA